MKRFCIQVSNVNESEFIQKLAFANGFRWLNNDGKTRHTNMPYLYFTNDIITFGEAGFEVNKRDDLIQFDDMAAVMEKLKPVVTKMTPYEFNSLKPGHRVCVCDGEIGLIDSVSKDGISVRDISYYGKSYFIEKGYRLATPDEIDSVTKFEVNDWVTCIPHGDPGIGYQPKLSFQITSRNPNASKCSTQGKFIYFGGHNTHGVFSHAVRKATEHEIKKAIASKFMVGKHNVEFQEDYIKVGCYEFNKAQILAIQTLSRLARSNEEDILIGSNGSISIEGTTCDAGTWDRIVKEFKKGNK